jgi:hypothetical protein
MNTELRCWQCGAEPTVVDITRTSDLPHRVLVPGRWPEPAVDHEHAVRPPTPAELGVAGDAARARMVTEW